MAYQLVRIGAVASVLLGAAVLSACNPTVASLSCDRIADEAKSISQQQPVKINSISNVREVSRTEQEARCQGNAAWTDNTNTEIYLRAYQQNGNTMVAYSDRGFDSAATPQQGAPPPAQGVPGYDQPQGGGNQQ